ncbi:MAG: tyrosine recombinase XerD [Phycisphaerae bacterium]|nr:MAG: tyrosine recombinase XerD [Phycisphaerae bacterium]
MPRRWSKSRFHRRPDRRATLVPPELLSFLGYLSSERGLARNTIEAYRRDLTDLIGWLNPPNGPCRASKLEEATAQHFRDYLQNQTRRNQSTKTVARRLAAIRVFLKYLEVMGQDKQHILQQLERPKPERDLPNILNTEQVARLIQAPDPSDTKFYHRDVAILELLYAAGLRASELCQLSVRDVNLEVAAVRVLGKGSKERIVPIGQACVRAIREYLRTGRPRLLQTPSQNGKKDPERLFLSRSGHPLDRVSLWLLILRYAKKIQLLNEVSPHVLRHCFASHLLSGGADLRIVQELLGHADVSTTQIYTHVDTGRLKKVHRQFHPRA